MIKAKRQTENTQVESAANALVAVMNELEPQNDYVAPDTSKYFPMLDEVKGEFAESMKFRVKMKRSLSDKMIEALDRMLEQWKNKPDYSKYVKMLNRYLNSTDTARFNSSFAGSMYAKINNGEILSEGMLKALDSMLAREQEKTQEVVPQKPSKIEVMVKVRKWMTSENFDRPLPVMEMEGEVLEEAGGSIKVRLQGSGRPSSSCRHCGRTITHPVSLFVGLGSKCGEHYGIDFTGGAAEINYEAIRAQMEKLLWEGWLPKSQITVTPIGELEEVVLPTAEELAKATTKKRKQQVKAGA